MAEQTLADKAGESNGTHNETGYRVEARVSLMNHQRPTRIQDGILTESWGEVTFNNDGNPAGVPPASGFRPFHDLLTLEAATALAWTLIAQSQSSFVECRLVMYKLRVVWEMARKGIVDAPVMAARLESPRIVSVKPVPESPPQ